MAVATVQFGVNTAAGVCRHDGCGTRPTTFSLEKDSVKENAVALLREREGGECAGSLGELGLRGRELKIQPVARSVPVAVALFHYNFNYSPLVLLI